MNDLDGLQIIVTSRIRRGAMGFFWKTVIISKWGVLASIRCPSTSSWTSKQLLSFEQQLETDNSITDEDET